MKPDYIVTGSRVYGVINKSSDLDIVLDLDDAMKLRTELQLKGIQVTTTPKQEYFSCYGGGYYFMLGILRVNIINAWSDDEMRAWEYATQKVKWLPPIEDKSDRNKKFQEFFWTILNKEEAPDA